MQSSDRVQRDFQALDIRVPALFKLATKELLNRMYVSLYFVLPFFDHIRARRRVQGPEYPVDNILPANGVQISEVEPTVGEVGVAYTRKAPRKEGLSLRLRELHGVLSTLVNGSK